MSADSVSQFGAVERIYARALIEAADEAGEAVDVSAAVAGLGELLEQEPGLAGLLASRALTATQRAESLERIFKGRTHDLLYRFLRVVADKGRLDVLPGIVRAYAKIEDERRNIIEGTAYVANETSDELIKQVAERIGKAVGHEVVLKQKTDPSLIGGIKIRIEDQLIDGSIAAQLKIIKNKLVAAGRPQGGGAPVGLAE